MESSDQLEALERIVGPINHAQRGEVLAALAEDSAGVLALAERLASSPSVLSPAALLIVTLRRNGHRANAQLPLTPSDRLPDAAEVFARLYFAKLFYLDGIDWQTPRDRQLEAMDYAVGYTPTCRHRDMPAGGCLQLERELCHELGIVR
jgi:hypothetical protein